MATLVTGGAGFIGSALAARLASAGEAVVVLDNFNDFYDPALKRANAARLEALGVEIVEGDVRDSDGVERVVANHAIRRIAHLAALANVRASIEQAPLYMQVNAIGSLNVLEAARRGELENVVLASTSSVYGRGERIPFREDDPADRPLASYPASKRAAEILGHSYTNLFGLPVTALRFFNVYGPAGRPDMMPLRLMRAISHGEAVPIFSEGRMERDWTYIDDVVAAVAAAVQRPMGYEVINLGLGAPIPLNDFIETVELLAGRKLIRVDAPAPPSEPPITFCDNAKARRLLDFDPTVPVREGLARTWEWFRAQATGDRDPSA